VYIREGEIRDMRAKPPGICKIYGFKGVLQALEGIESPRS